ncbi:chondroitin AC lyase [Ephemerocybe angulata]|uniref:Chondroitin AC lyase n=1 Tax=Ephemerocybe angulata TaxID=980116 RepID=A0A8H6MGM9_9AGAR|nr:chondroitin AC lyase [Tulosesus angulatus]
MAGAWHGGAPMTEQWNGSSDLRQATGRAMAYWFKRDFQNQACLDQGGSPACPCDNPGNTLWNTNWFSNIILIPDLVAQSCLLLRDSLSSDELSHCAEITTRTYGVFHRDLHGAGFLAGANILGIGKISVDAAILNKDADMLEDAYQRIHQELAIRNELKADGIRADGSFGQHRGILYNGNYGKDYSKAALDVEIAAADTKYRAKKDSKAALELLFQGNEWMVYANTVTKVLNWDNSVLGRMVSLPTADKVNGGSVRADLGSVQQLGDLWNSNALKRFGNLLQGASMSSANPGTLVGNKMFFANDYMVHRGSNHITTLKMYSTRTDNTECINDQNKEGFHLSDGTMYTYVTGNEYEDAFAAWDWNLIPGITVDYKNTPLTCAGITHTGVESFVGGVSNGLSGLSAMRYTNPISKSLKWQKAWFLLESGVYHVMVNVLDSKSKAPVYSVLDQKRESGDTKVVGKAGTNSTYTNPVSIWHANVGYTFPSNTTATLTVQKGQSKGDWSAIGTSAQPPTTVDMWAAWLEHTDVSSPLEYSIWPGLEYADFQDKSSQSPVATIENSQKVSAIYDRNADRILAVVWTKEGGSFTFDSPETGKMRISTLNAMAFMVSLKDGAVMASDPSQSLGKSTITIEFENGQHPAAWKRTKKGTKTVKLKFSTGGEAGSSINGVSRMTVPGFGPLLSSILGLTVFLWYLLIGNWDIE